MPVLESFFNKDAGVRPAILLTLLAPTQQNGQTHSNTSLAFADEWFECV